MTLAHGNATSDGGAIYAESSSISFSGNTSFMYNSAGRDGGAIYAFSSSVTWDGDGTKFSRNSAGKDGGAICAIESTASWDGDGAEFIHNYASSAGGAIFALHSIVSWDGDGAGFSNNYAGDDGGAIWLLDSNVSWDGDGVEFSSNYANYSGGGVRATSSSVSWDGDRTELSNNDTSHGGGAIGATNSIVSWEGDGAEFSNNYATDNGGSIQLYHSSVSWDGEGTNFSNNAAGHDGGAIFASGQSAVSWRGPTSFHSNAAGDSGGAVALVDFGVRETFFADAAFIDNNSKNGGAFYLYNSPEGFSFTNVRFQSNSASGAGGAFAVYAGTDHLPVFFSRCSFSDNTAAGAGGAVETLSGHQEFVSCDFEGNSADVGGAMRLGGDAVVRNSSFLSNAASTRGLAIAVIWSTNITDSSFSGNELHCAAGLYREDVEQEESTARFDTVCLDCPSWDECSGCSITRGNVTPTCAAPLEHTTAEEPGVALETLNITEGYWRATNTSYDILPCFNAAACSGGQTGAKNYCASGYTGSYCAVCETDYARSLGHTCTRCSSSTRHGLLAAAIIAATVVVVAVLSIFKYLVSTDFEERNMGWFHRKVLRALPVQALKITVVVWQILTQFADAANVTYPGIYQDFLSVIDIVNFDLSSATAAGCVLPTADFHDRLLVITLWPLAVVGFLAVTYRIAVIRNGVAGNNGVVDKIRYKHQTALLLLTFLVYSSVSSMVFQTYACETLDDEIEYLRADYRIRCTGAKHKAFELYAGFMVVIYPVGIPLLYAILLYRRRDILSDVHADKAAAQPISSLWEPYRPERFYYEVIECGRRIMLTGVVVFIFPNDAAQIAITMLISFVFFAVFDALSPYKSTSDMWLSRGGHMIVFFSMFDMLLLKVDVSSESDQSQAVFAGVLVAAHVLIILVIVVEIVGIWCASRKSRVVDEAIPSQTFPDLRSRVGSDDGVPVFESAPASWRSFMRSASVSERPCPVR
ncbi:unnamed protein product, partial [Hapterophycus canaliculatus]